MEQHYTSEKNAQILIALMKAHHIKKVIVSPGTTNVCFVASIQQDSYFEIYSSVDERSAAYMACGLAAESGEPVALSCTGATASRNYMPGLTEAFYRKLPILAITSTQPVGRIGHYPQVIDRTSLPNDVALISVHIPMIKDTESEWAYSVKINEALLELRHRGGGPVHINLTTEYELDFNVKKLPQVQVINRIGYSTNEYPKIKAKTVGVFVGAHMRWSSALTEAVDKFCETYNGAVLCDHTSNYKGKYEIHPNLVVSSSRQNMDLMIHIGDVSGAYMSLRPNQVWRVNPDGVLRDPFKKLRYVFETDELTFFQKYIDKREKSKNIRYYNDWLHDYSQFLEALPELPFSNAWIAQHTIAKIPENSVIHFGILNSLRSWNYFELSKTVLGYSNTGGFGIDGALSTLLGASLSAPNKLFFGVIGDLAFFYDMNLLGNRHVENNIRLLLINNGCGIEMKLQTNQAGRLGDASDAFLAASGHYGKKSRVLVKNYVESLGFEYLTASNKEEYLTNLDHFTTRKLLNKPIVFEVFTEVQDENEAFKIITGNVISLTGKAKKILKGGGILNENIFDNKTSDDVITEIKSCNRYDYEQFSEQHYTSEKNAQILIALMKAHHIKKVIVSPGTTNVCFVASIQQDSYFEIYSSVDERSAAYMACGLAAESGEPVALSCTGATASRNYMPGLTEAFYRKLPILAITSTTGRIGSYTQQVIDRSNSPKDIKNLSVQIPMIKDEEDILICEDKINEALLELRHRGGGPVHINLATTYSPDFSIKELPNVRVIERIDQSSKNFPYIKFNHIAIVVGSHVKWEDDLTETVDAFCESYNGVVFCDHNSNYKGKYAIHPDLTQISCRQNLDLVVHIGEVAAPIAFTAQQVWRVNPDGAVHNTFKKLRYVFEMEEIDFFRMYTRMASHKCDVGYYQSCKSSYSLIKERISEIPFSNAWIAKNTIDKLPDNSVLHLAILNSLRCWSFFPLSKKVFTHSNTGGFGIDGALSTLLGASLSTSNQLFFGVVGDLAFFYDMNALGNRHINTKIRILLINNGCGMEMRFDSNPAGHLGDFAKYFMAAEGHYGKKSHSLVRYYAENLGFEYMSASSKDEYLSKVSYFITPKMLDKPLLFEVFTNIEDENNALTIIQNAGLSPQSKLKKIVKRTIGEKNIKNLKKILKR